MLFQHHVGNVGHAEGLEDAPVRTQVQTGQAGFYDGAVAGVAEAGFTLLEAADRTVDVAHGLATLPDGEQRGTVENLAKFEGGIAAAQVDFEAKGFG